MVMLWWLLLSQMGTYTSMEDHPQDSIVVLTYNIHHGEGKDGQIDLDRIAHSIKKIDPDVVCLQEVDRNLPRTNQLDFPTLLAQKLNMTVFFGPNYHFDGGDYGNASFTRLPVIESKNILLPNPLNTEPRGCLILKVLWNNHEVTIMNTHLGLKGLERFAQAEKISELLFGMPVILAGDMNESETAPAMNLLLAKMHDTFNGRKDMQNTMSQDYPLKRRIDFILASYDFEVTDASFIISEETQIASDHFPYWAALRLPEKK